MPHLRELELHNFRLFSHLVWQPSDRINFIFGDNGLGKTSLLEAVYYLSRQRSFRATRIDEIINHQVGEDSESSPPNQDSMSRAMCRIRASVDANLAEDAKLKTKTSAKEMSMLVSPNSRKLYLDHALQRNSRSWITSLPVILVAPHNINLVDASPSERRAYLDGILFYLKPDYASKLKDYNRCLRQRNRLLFQLSHKSNNNSAESRSMEVWTEKMSEYGEWIESARREILPLVMANLNSLADYFNLEKCKISYKQGWDEEISMLQDLHNSQKRDLAIGFTTKGSHKSDFVINYQDKEALRVLSLGQQKLISFSFFLAAASILGKDASFGTPVILLDDIVTQLDDKNCAMLLELFTKRENQVIITATAGENMLKYGSSSSDSCWRIAEGQIGQFA